MSIVCTVTVLCALVHIGATETLHLYCHDMEVETVDPEYFDPENTERFISDDSGVTTNWTIVKKFPPETTSSITIFGYALGMYTNPTVPKRVWTSFCEMVQDPLAIDYFTSLGITFDDCPPEPGNYFKENYHPPVESMVTGVPDNKYLVILEIAVGERILFKDKVWLETQTF